MGRTELGIDEAGRGPVLGPMVMAGVVIPEEKGKLLTEWGIADSKTYGSGKSGKAARSKLARLIIDHFDHKIVLLSSQTVDQFVRNSSLNRLEQEAAQSIIDELKADFVVMDGKNLFSPLISENKIAVDKADSDYLSVAAASIIAKDERDRRFLNLCKPFLEEYGEIAGGGYANKKTLEFVEWYLKLKGSLPPFYRKSFRWKALDLPESSYQ
jgi:ribonuclease HII